MNRTNSIRVTKNIKQFELENNILTSLETKKEQFSKEENALAITQIIVDTGLIPEGVNLSEEQKDTISKYIRGNATTLKNLLQQDT